MAAEILWDKSHWGKGRIILLLFSFRGAGLAWLLHGLECRLSAPPPESLRLCLERSSRSVLCNQTVLEHTWKKQPKGIKC